MIAKLAAEISMENEMKENEGIPTSVKDFIDHSNFEVYDVPGEEDVVLTRNFGDEK